MKYGIKICACAALMSMAPAWAQDEAAVEGISTTPPKAQQGVSSVTIYGLLDQGLEYVNNVATSKTTTASTVRVSSGTATSYFGMRGTESLGGSLQAVWDLQGGFAPDNGTSSQGGRLFGRQSYVGLAGNYGSLTFGRQYTMRFFATSPINPFGTGSHGLTTLDEGIANARADNSVSYRYRSGGIDAGVNYSFGRDAVDGKSKVASNCGGEAPGAPSQCREWSAMFKYEAARWGVTSGYERQYGGTAATFGGLTNPGLTDSRLILGGYFLVGDAKLGVGWIRRINQAITTPRSNLFWLSGKVPITPNISIDGMVAQIRYDDSPNKALTFVLRGVYAFSKRTSLYVTADHITNSGNLAFAATTATPVVAPPPGGSQISVIAGVRHIF